MNWLQNIMQTVRSQLNVQTDWLSRLLINIVKNAQRYSCYIKRDKITWDEMKWSAVMSGAE